SVGPTTLTGLLVECMRKREADRRRKTLAGALRQCDLRAVVVGIQRVRYRVDVRVIRILAVERPGKLNSRGIDGGRFRDRGREGSACTCCGNGCDLCRRKT